MLILNTKSRAPVFTDQGSCFADLIFLNMLCELISSIDDYISIEIDAQSESSNSKPKERNMPINFTQNIL